MAYKPPARAGATVYVWADYSLAERDRRWKAVQDAGKKAGFDCIFVPLGDGVDARYLTQLRCSSVVMPTDGRAPIVIADRSSKNTWAPEPWQTSREWSEPMAEALLENGMERARIGVAGLKGGRVTHITAIDGVVNHGAFSAVMQRLPNARFEDATDVVGFVRYTKSEEEIAAMRKATAIAESGIDELKKVARPGVDAAQVYADVMACMMEQGNEYFPFALTIDGKRFANPPLGVRLKANDQVHGEIISVWGTQIAEEAQTVALGAAPAALKALVERHREVYDAGLKLLKAGTPCEKLLEFDRQFTDEKGFTTKILLCGRGAGDDGPVIDTSSSVEKLKGISVEKNTLWLWRPTVSDGNNQFTWGGTVLVTDKGAERLAKRPHGILTVT
jgi:Xaa-Pro aminopeptidase